jgi:hypothetical protein
MSLLLLAHYVNKLMLRLLQMQIAVLCACQAMGGLKQPLERGTMSGIPFPTGFVPLVLANILRGLFRALTA